MNLAPVQPLQPVSPVPPDPVRRVRDWLDTYVTTVHDDDLDVLALWAVHTHLVKETYTTPRLLIDSPVPGSGKTTVLDHLSRLCHNPIQAATVSSPAMLARLIDKGITTILIDEADRSLNPKLEKTGELLAVLNSGYRYGATRPVNVPKDKGGWEVKAMSTFSPVAMAGNAPNLPGDTMSRCLRVLLMPDIDGTAEESDWEVIENEAAKLEKFLAEWAEEVRASVKLNRPTLPDGVRGRDRERWGPLKRVAVAAGGSWPDTVDRLALVDVERIANERDDGVMNDRPHLVLLGHLHKLFDNQDFVGTTDIVDHLIKRHPDAWGPHSSYGKALTVHRLGRLMVKHFNVTSSRPGGSGQRGYTKASLEPAFRSLPVSIGEPVNPVEAVEPVPPQAGTGACQGCR